MRLLHSFLSVSVTQVRKLDSFKFLTNIFYLETDSNLVMEGKKIFSSQFLAKLLFCVHFIPRTKRSWRDAIYCVLQYPWNMFRCYSVNVFSWPQYYKFTNAEKVLNRIFTKTVGLEYEEPFNKPSIATIKWVRIWSDANSLSVLSFVLYVVTQLLSCFF